jgi:hypothetical protein
MSSKIIIITTLTLLLLGFSVLFIVEAKNHNYDYKKDWVAVYFNSPNNDSLDFSIENHEGLKMTYSYDIYVNDNKISESVIEIEKGAKQEISPSIAENDLSGIKKITVIVSSKDADYKIYKNIK